MLSRPLPMPGHAGSRALPMGRTYGLAGRGRGYLQASPVLGASPDLTMPGQASQPLAMGRMNGLASRGRGNLQASPVWGASPSQFGDDPWHRYMCWGAGRGPLPRIQVEWIHVNEEYKDDHPHGIFKRLTIGLIISDLNFKTKPTLPNETSSLLSWAYNKCSYLYYMCKYWINMSAHKWTLCSLLCMIHTRLNVTGFL